MLAARALLLMAGKPTWAKLIHSTIALPSDFLQIQKCRALPGIFILNTPISRSKIDHTSGGT
jgi:hypothetical protein